MGAFFLTKTYRNSPLYVSSGTNDIFGIPLDQQFEDGRDPSGCRDESRSLPSWQHADLCQRSCLVQRVVLSGKQLKDS